MVQSENLVREWFESALRSGLDRLPPERILAEQLGLSRAELRKGLAILDAEGLLLRQVGRGTFLRDAAPVSLAPTVLSGGLDEMAAISSPRHYLAARLLIEPRLAKLAALEATARQFDAILSAEDDARRADDWPDFEAADSRFHREIAAASSNPILLHLFDGLSTARSAIGWGRLGRRPPFDATVFAGAGEEHARIRQALIQRDGDAAEAAMAHHVMVENSTIMVLLV